MDEQGSRSQPHSNPRASELRRSRSNASSDFPTPSAKRSRIEDGLRPSITSQDEFGHSTVQGHARVQFGHQYYFGTNNPQRHSVMDESTSAALQEPHDVMKSLEYDRMRARYLTLKPGLARTCEWLYDNKEHISWRNRSATPTHHGCLWIKGKPGSGKTTLMKMAVDNDKRRFGSDAVISHFFFRSGGNVEVSAEKMYRSLVYQLLKQIPRLQSVLDIWTAANLQRHEWPTDLLQNIFRAAILLLENDVLTCYVDALDECDDYEALGIIEFFEDLSDAAVSEGVRFYFCVSSRHYPHITMAKCEELVLDYQEGHSQDISTFVKSRLKLTNSARKRKLVREICERASGVFMWVALVVGQLNLENHKGYAHNLQKCLETMPTELPELFERIVRRGTGHDPEFVATIQWIVFSKRPLGCEELYCAVRGSSGYTNSPTATYQVNDIEDMERFILRSSKGFLELVKGKYPTFQFIHETVREYFYSRGLAQFSPTLSENITGQSHNRLKKFCRDYILQDALKRSMVSLPERLPRARSEADIEIRDRIEAQFPFLKYALTGLIYHADSAGDHNIPQDDFMEVFPKSTWKRLSNCLEKYQTRRYANYVGHDWILVEQDTPFLLELYLRQHPHINPGFRRGLSLLGVAIEHKCLRNVVLLLKHGAQAQSIAKRIGTRDVMSCLDLAVDKSSADIIRELTASGARADKSTVHLAVQRGDLEILQAVISNRIDTATRSQAHGEVLWSASLSEKIDILHWLLEKGAAVDANCGTQGTALQAACAKGSISIVLMLLERGADVNVECGIYDTALHAASGRGHASIVNILRDRGANIDACGRDSETALHIACKQGHQDVVRMLLNAGSKLNAQSGSHATALHAAILGWNKSEIFDLLIEKGANVNLRLGDRGSALQIACAARCPLHGSSPNAYTQEAGFWVSDSRPVRMCSVYIVRLLLDRGSHINARGGKYGGALQAACARSCMKVVRLLLDRGADPIAEGGIYGSISNAVQSNRRKDIAEMVTSATAKRLEILERFREAARASAETQPARPTVPLVSTESSRDRCEIDEQQRRETSSTTACEETEEPIPIVDQTIAQESRASSRHRCETEAQQHKETVKKTLPQGPEKPLGTLPNVEMRLKSHSSFSSRKPVTQAKKDHSHGEPIPIVRSNFKFDNASSGTASQHLKSTPAINRTTQFLHNKTMEKTMSSLFGLEYEPQPQPQTKVRKGLHSKVMAKTMVSLFGLEYRPP